jgi:methionine--tRNA ligase beta chain
MITFDEFSKVEITIGKILSAEKVEGSEKLLKLGVDFGEENPRQVVSGIAKYFPELEKLIGTKHPFVTNLEPRAIMGLESQAMILAASHKDSNSFSLLDVGETIPQGTKLS